MSDPLPCGHSLIEAKNRSCSCGGSDLVCPCGWVMNKHRTECNFDWVPYSVQTVPASQVEGKR